MPDPFDDFEIISTYTTDEALEDGTIATLPDEPSLALPGDPMFDLGRVVATPGVLADLEHKAIVALVNRHVCGDWGDLDPSDANKNKLAVRTGEDRIFSAYKIGDEKVFIITEWDRSVTTVMWAHEY